jgi:16S rRNA G527 N7-methylase RsmG
MVFHVKHHDLWRAVAAECGQFLDESGLRGLDVYRQWLEDEAIPAGALGPAEVDRLHDRHIADSLLFSVGFPTTPSRVLDYGSGAGLPGLPLAVMWPATDFLLLDRSGRRVNLVRRAVRILSLENVQVEQGDIERYRPQEAAVVSRATLPPQRAAAVLPSLLAPDGTAVLGGSWSSRPSAPGFETREVASKILDRTIWLLIMRRT